MFPVAFVPRGARGVVVQLDDVPISEHGLDIWAPRWRRAEELDSSVRPFYNAPRECEETLDDVPGLGEPFLGETEEAQAVEDAVENNTLGELEAQVLEDIAETLDVTSPQIPFAITKKFGAELPILVDKLQNQRDHQLPAAIISVVSMLATEECQGDNGVRLLLGQLQSGDELGEGIGRGGQGPVLAAESAFDHEHHRRVQHDEGLHPGMVGQVPDSLPVTVPARDVAASA